MNDEIRNVPNRSIDVRTAIIGKRYICRFFIKVLNIDNKRVEMRNRLGLEEDENIHIYGGEGVFMGYIPIGGNYIIFNFDNPSLGMKDFILANLFEI